MKTYYYNTTPDTFNENAENHKSSEGVFTEHLMVLK
jgi:hypothetical protein